MLRGELLLVRAGIKCLGKPLQENQRDSGHEWAGKILCRMSEEGMEKMRGEWAGFKAWMGREDGLHRGRASPNARN
eukprot:1158425-Pelagomonas_calceolata.AAC.9